MYTNRTIDRFFSVASNDPRYRSFVQAQNMNLDYMARGGNLYNELLGIHGDRINTYLRYWDMYFGKHWFSISEENLDPMKVNYCAITVNKNVAFLMNKGFKISSRFPEIEQFLQNNWDLNSAQKDSNLWGANLAIQGCITGDAFFDIKKAVHKEFNVEYYKYDILDSAKCFPVLDNNSLKGLLYYGKNSFVVKENNGFAEYEDRYNGFYYNETGSKAYIKDEKVTNTIQYDLHEIPVIHIKNFPIPQAVSFYGLSDLINVTELNLAYDRVLTDIQDTIDYHAQPITILTGAKASELTRGANRIWSLPQGADISNLRLEGELLASTNHLEQIRKNIAESTNVPEASIGKEQSISNTSATALAIAFMPLYETMEYKRVVYGTGLLKANTYTLKLAFMEGKISPSKIIKNALDNWRKDFADADEATRDRYYPFSQKIDEEYDYDTLEAFYNNKIPAELFQTSIIWFPPLPRDEVSTANMIMANIQSQIWSRSYGRKMQGMNEQQSLQVEKEIIKETKELGEMLGTTLVTNEKTGLEGDNTIKGINETERRKVQNSNV